MATRDEIDDLVDEAAELRRTFRFHEAEPLLRRALQLAEEGYGPEALEACRPLDQLGVLLNCMAGCPAASPEGITLLRRAHAIAARDPGERNARLAVVMDHLGSALADTDDGREEGLAFIREAISLIESHSALTRQTSWILMGLAYRLLALERYEEALPVAERHLALEAGRGATVMGTTAYVAVAEALLGVGRPTEALDHFQRAQEMASAVGMDGVADDATAGMKRAQLAIARGN